MRALFARTLAGAVVVLAAGCTVDDSVLDRALYPCEIDSDCGEGYGCAYAGNVGTSFCTPRPTPCDETSCDGVCTAEGLCVRGCTINADGSATPCPIEGTQCIRFNLMSDQGGCYPINACSLNEQCSTDGSQFCLSSLFVGEGMGSSSRLYCLPQGTSCPAGYMGWPKETPDEMFCFQACGVEDLRCPPATSCFFGYCFPGFYGLACNDDTNCLTGECLPGDAGGVCSERCSSLEALGLTCANLVTDFSRDFLTFVCDPAADVCLARYLEGFPCNSRFVCNEGLECVTFFDAGATQLCRRPCTDAAQCPSNMCHLDPDNPAVGYCLPPVEIR